MRKHLTIVALLLLLPALSLAGKTGGGMVNSQPNANHFTVSLLFPDGSLLPFAEYSEGRWLNPWPKPDSFSDEEPNTVVNLSKPWFAQGKRPSATWYFWTPDGEPHVLKAGKVIKVDTHCQTAWGLQSDLTRGQNGVALPAGIGVALDVKRQVSPVTEVSNASDEWKNFLSFIRPAFGREEEARFAELSSFLTPPGGDERNKINVTLSHVYRGSAEVGGRYLYYFEAQKDYAKPIPTNEQSCNNVFFRGWGAASAQGDLSLSGTQIGWDDCDRKQQSGRVPLATLSVDGRVYVITYDPSYEGESYSILEWTESGVRLVLETQGGSC
jgi:hypothetical protein